MKDSNGRSGRYRRGELEMKALKERPVLGVLSMAAAILAVAVVIGGCGSSSTSSTGGETGPSTEASTNEAAGGGESSSPGVAKAQEEVERLNVTEGLEWPKPPQKAFKSGHHTAAIIACGLAGEGCKDQAEAAQEAFKAAGWSTTPLGDGEFNPATQGNLIQQAIQENVSAIVLVAVEPPTVKSAVDAAIAKHIPLSCMGCATPPEYTENESVIDSGVNPEKSGEALGYWIVANSEGKGKTISFVDHAFEDVVLHNTGTKKVVEELCPACEYEEVPFATAELEKPGPPVFSAALSSNPAGTVEWIDSNSATYGTPMVKTALQQGREELKVVGTETTPEFLAEMEKSEVANALIYYPFAYEGWAAADNMIREVNHQPTWETDELPMALITKETVPTYLKDSPKIYEEPGFDFRSMFEKLWGVKG
jgi:ABC-type sugar transport system substrate-binding protein